MKFELNLLRNGAVLSTDVSFLIKPVNYLYIYLFLLIFTDLYYTLIYPLDSGKNKHHIPLQIPAKLLLLAVHYKWTIPSL